MYRFSELINLWIFLGWINDCSVFNDVHWTIDIVIYKMILKNVQPF